MTLHIIDPVARSRAVDEVRSLVVDIASYASADVIVASGRRRTEKMVIEAEVDVSGNFRASLPSELMDLLSSDVQMDDASGGVRQHFLVP